MKENKLKCNQCQNELNYVKVEFFGYAPISSLLIKLLFHGETLYFCCSNCLSCFIQQHESLEQEDIKNQYSLNSGTSADNQ